MLFRDKSLQNLQAEKEKKGIRSEMSSEMSRSIEEMIAAGREFMKEFPDTEGVDLENYRTDQELKKPQPPLYKEPMGGTVTALPDHYRDLPMKKDILEILYKRKSSRVYTQKQVSLLELSYLLWATQGVKAVRGQNYATIRTVACGGARHEFECYLAVRQVEGLKPGYYHYMPDRHAVELIKEFDLSDEVQEELWKKEISESLCGQNWSWKANVIFYYSVIPYRAEWRYGIWAHRTALIDAGHITQNLYVACSSLELGACAIASVDTETANQMFGMDGREEFIFYAATMGTISEADQKEEDAFYAFLKEEE